MCVSLHGHRESFMLDKQCFFFSPQMINVTDQLHICVAEYQMSFFFFHGGSETGSTSHYRAKPAGLPEPMESYS